MRTFVLHTQFNSLLSFHFINPLLPSVLLLQLLLLLMKIRNETVRDELSVQLVHLPRPTCRHKQRGHHRHRARQHLATAALAVDQLPTPRAFLAATDAGGFATLCFGLAFGDGDAVVEHGWCSPPG